MTTSNIQIPKFLKHRQVGTDFDWRVLLRLKTALT